MLKENKRIPLNLQFFADDGNGDENTDNKQNENKDSNNSDNGGEKRQEKTFTQEQVNGMMAKEKNEGKKSVLKALGFGSEEEAKKAIQLYNAMIESQKSEEEKAKEAFEKSDREKEEYRIRAEEAEFKALCLEYGVDKDYVSDILAIAKLRVDDKKDMNKVLSEMQKDKKYSSFFQKQSEGTGSDPGHSGGSSSSTGDYGKKLAERMSGNRSENKKVSSFFN